MHLIEKLLGISLYKTFTRLMRLDLGDLAFLPDSAIARPFLFRDEMRLHVGAEITTLSNKSAASSVDFQQAKASIS